MNQPVPLCITNKNSEAGKCWPRPDTRHRRKTNLFIKINEKYHDRQLIINILLENVKIPILMRFRYDDTNIYVDSVAVLS